MSIPPSSSYVVPYGLSSRAPRPVLANRAPSSSTDLGYDAGTIWCNQTGSSGTAAAYINIQSAGGSAFWQPVAGGSVAIATITGDSGGALSPSSGNFNILGTAGQITTTGSGSTLTLSIPASFTIGSNAGSSTASLLAGSGGLTIDGAASSNIVIGGSVVSGGITVGGAAMTGTLNFGNSTGAQTVNVGVGASGVKTIHIGDGASANVITVGSLTGAASLALQSGTGGISLASGVTNPGTISMTPATQSSATTPITLNARLGQATFTGFTTASGATEIFVISNNIVTATTQAVHVCVDNLGANDAQMTISRVLLAVGSITVYLKNNGTQALNGDVHINFWVLN